MDVGGALSLLDVVAREATLFAGTGFLIGGIDDLAVDLCYLATRSRPAPLPPPPREGIQPFAILLPAWDEANVIGAMLAATLARLGSGDYRLYVGVYRNDPRTIAAVADIAAGEPRVRLVFNPRPGPTTKGDNLNVLWRALLRDEAAEGWSPAGIVLHDAEDVVDPDELRAFDALLDTHDVVQLPVVPLIARHSRWVSAHYADEFVETHSRSLVVRQALGAGLPLAGTGCAIRRETLARVADARGGQPFDPHSLTEDYDLGLALAAQGGRGCFARLRADDGRAIAVRAFFPTGFNAAVRQKARWMMGIALLGWDRIGWGRRSPLAEYWMRMRDRRGPLAMLVLAAGWLAAAAASLSASLHLATGLPAAAMPDWLAPLFLVNSAILGWRLAMRATATAAVYGWREGGRALPRLIVANTVGLAAACRALARYLAILCGAPTRWDKTCHSFPVDPAAAAR